MASVSSASSSYWWRRPLAMMLAQALELEVPIQRQQP